MSKKNKAVAPSDTAPAVHPGRAATTAAQWLNPATAAARKARRGVEVDGVIYASVPKAFVALGLPIKKCAAFRVKLKAAPDGCGVFADYAFKLTPTEAEAAA